MFAIAKFIAGLFGLDISLVQRVLWIAVMVVAAVLVLIGVVSIRNCGKKQPKFDQAEVTKAQEIIANADRKEKEQWLANVAANTAAIDANVADAKALAVNAASQAKRDAANKTNEELAAEIERMLEESK